MEDDLICGLSCIEPRISILSNNTHAQPSHRMWQLLNAAFSCL